MLPQERDTRESAFIPTYGGVPPGLAQWTCLPSAKALGLIIPSSGLGRCFIPRNWDVFHPRDCGVFHPQDRAGACSRLRRRDRECWRSSLNTTPLDGVLATCLHVDQSEGGTFAFLGGLDRYDTLVILGAYFEFDFVACVIALALDFVRILLAVRVHVGI